jgi:hypothetical protein
MCVCVRVCVCVLYIYIYIYIESVSARDEWSWMCIQYAEILSQRGGKGRGRGGGGGVGEALDLLYTVLSFLPHSPQVRKHESLLMCSLRLLLLMCSLQVLCAIAEHESARTDTPADLSLCLRAVDRAISILWGGGGSGGGLVEGREAGGGERGESGEGWSGGEGVEDGSALMLDEVESMWGGWGGAGGGVLWWDRAAADLYSRYAPRRLASAFLFLYIFC